jgi:SAM-dependent methyltransferase
MKPSLTRAVARILGPHWTARLRCLVRGRGIPLWGNLRRTAPFSTRWGFDRGTPVDRYYLERFLEKHRPHIRGDVLEIQLPIYTRRYGHDLGAVHTVDIDPAHAPTYLCDLSRAEQMLPANRYDCVLLPFTLHILRDVEGALRNVLRTTKPGGVILAATSGFVPLMPDGPDYWHTTADGWTELTRRAWAGCDIAIQSHGNCLAGVAALLGLASEELTAAELDTRDRRYPVTITIFCRKAGATGPADRL